MFQQRHQLPVLLQDGFEVGDGLVGGDVHAGEGGADFEVAHEVHRLEGFANPRHSAEDGLLLPPGIRLFCQLLDVLKFILKQFDLEDAARGVDEVEHVEVEQLSVLVLYLGDYDFLDGFRARLQVHLEEVVGVELVVDEQSVALGHCVHQR